MLKNILGILSIFLAIAGVADAAFYPDNYGIHRKHAVKDWLWYLHNQIPGMKVHVDRFDDYEYKNSLKLFRPLKPETIKHIPLYKITDYHENLYNKPEINANTLDSNDKSNSILKNANDINKSSSESTRGEANGERTVLDDSTNRNTSASKDIAEFSNNTAQSLMQETNNIIPVLVKNSTESNEAQTTDNQTLVSDTNSTSIPPTSSSENDLDSTVMNETSKLSTEKMANTSTADYESTSTGKGETQTSENEIDGQETRLQTASTGDVIHTTLDFTEETSKSYSTFKVKSTSLDNEVSLSTDSQKVISKSPTTSTEGSASSNIYTSPEPSVSHRVTDRRYSVSNPKTGTPSSTEFPENNLLEQPEQVIELQGIRTLKIVVSVVFMVIAFVAGTVLIVFIFKVKRREVQYDQLTLLP